MFKKEDFTIDVMSKIDDDIVERNLKKRFELWMRRSKPNKNRWAALIASAACFCIIVTSVFLFWPDGKQVPVYLGMSVSNDAPTVTPEQRSIAEEGLHMPTRSFGNTLSLTFLNNTNGKGNGNGNGNSDVKNIPEISGGPYYALPGEDIYIYVHIDNPDEFEILSFTLNDVKYSSYMFVDGSDLNTLILKYNVGDAEGIQQYTIDAIKYVDGDDIKDVRMDGDKTIEVLVGATDASVSFNTEFIGWDLSISPVWDDSFGGEKKLTSLAVYDGETLIKECDTNATTVSGLPSNKRLILVATYDDNGTSVTLRKVIDTPKLSEGLEISCGVITGIGSCTDTVLYVDMPIGDQAFQVPFGENKYLTAVYCGPGVTSIGDLAFAMCTALETVILPDTLKSIGYLAFDGCTSLENITLPESIENIEEAAFQASGLKSIQIPDGISVISEGMFSGCEQLSTVVLPKSIKTIEIIAFHGCGALSEIIYEGSLKDWARIDIHDYWYSDSFANPYEVLGEVTVKCTDGEIIIKEKAPPSPF